MSCVCWAWTWGWCPTETVRSAQPRSVPLIPSTCHRSTNRPALQLLGSPFCLQYRDSKMTWAFAWAFLSFGFQPCAVYAISFSFQKRVSVGFWFLVYCVAQDGFEFSTLLPLSESSGMAEHAWQKCFSELEIMFNYFLYVLPITTMS